MNKTRRHGSLCRGIALFLAIGALHCGNYTAADDGKADAETKAPHVKYEVPKAAKSPLLKGRIRAEHWADALKITRLSHALVPAYADGQMRRWIVTDPAIEPCDRDVTFWLMWDANRLYLAGRSAVPEGRTLSMRQHPDRPRPPLLHDDAYEFAVDASAVEPDNEAANGVLMCIFTAFGLEQARKLPREFRVFGKMPAVDPELDMASSVWTDEEGTQWWDMQVAFDLEHLGLSGPLEAGDTLRVSLARMFQFPWHYTFVPCSSSYMDSEGFPEITLTNEKASAEYPPGSRQENAEQDTAEDDSEFLDFRPDYPSFPVDLAQFDPKTENLTLQGDAVLASMPEGESAAAMAYQVLGAGLGDSAAKGVCKRRADNLFRGHLDLSAIPPGRYRIRVALRNAAGDPLLERTLEGFEKSGQGNDARYVWWLGVEADTVSLAQHDPLNGPAPVSARINHWYRQGKAAGNAGDFYHNHDHLHSYLGLRAFPQITPIDATKAGRSLVSAGLQHRKLFTGIVIGNASMVAKGYSLPELAYRNPHLASALHEQYANNHVYLYPSHTTRAAAYTAYTPYVIATKGSSGSEKKIMEALFATLAAFPPDTKKNLAEHTLIAPTLQMLLRRHYDGIANESEYLGGKAHPVVFKQNSLGIEAMVESAHAMTPDCLPPLAKLSVIEEEFETGGSDERWFTTPNAIARLVRDPEATRTARISALDSLDAHGRELSWKWVLLRGAPESTSIEPLDEAGSQALITFKPQPERVDIAVFATNGTYWSAPAIISCKYLPASENAEQKTKDQR